MTKYSFIKEIDDSNHFDTTRVQIDVHTNCLSDVVEAFEVFLKGSGFVFDGAVDIVPAEEDIMTPHDEDVLPE